MRQRCELPTRTSFEHYGGKGISVCTDWKDFSSFESWAHANGYNDSLTIDRIDVNGNYQPANCRWITKAENSRRAHTKHGRIRCVDTNEVFENCRCVVAARTDAGAILADASSVLKAIKHGRNLYGKRYEFVI